MAKLNKFLVVVIFILTAVLVAAVGLMAYDIYSGDRQREDVEMAELFARNQEAQDRVQEMQAEIQELTNDKEELQRFIAQLQNDDFAGTAYDTASKNDSVSENSTVSGNATVSGNTTVSGNATVSGNQAGSVSSNEKINYYDGTRTDDSIFDPWREIYHQPDGMTLAERRQLRTSLEETLEVNQADRERIVENKIDFSELKIACLGDSITAAANLEDEEDYQQYAYPTKLQELLDAEEVYNLGIGGSTIGRYWSDPFVDRYQDIPEDSDIIIVLGGTNDGFCVSEKEFGSLDERAYGTFCGDLDELMGGLREHYPDAVIFFATPLPNILQDYLMSERDYLLPQQDFVDVILTLADEYEFEIIDLEAMELEVIDLYNSNILDSHDANIVADYMPDGVHCNPDGYQILAEHFASELIQYFEKVENEASETVSENSLEAVSGDDSD